MIDKRAIKIEGIMPEFPGVIPFSFIKENSVEKM